MKSMFRNALTVATVAGLMAGAAMAQSAAEGAIKARKAHMQLQGFYLGPLAGMAKGEVPYDAARASMLATNLNTLVSVDFAPYFPEGSAQGQAEGTRALPAIWEKPEEVAAALTGFRTATAALAAAAGTDQAALQAALGPVGQACGSCHQAYRATQ